MDLNSSSSSITPPLCAKGCGFYGSKENKNMCSKCYKDFIMNTNANESTNSMDVLVQRPQIQVAPSVLVDSFPFPLQSGSSSSETNVSVDSCAETSSETNVTADSIAETSSTTTKAKNRCKNCNKKVGLTGFKCRCGNLFCWMHRYPNEHACTFDFKSAHREILVKNNPLIKGEKLDGKI